jgi:hypothetical protein
VVRQRIEWGHGGDEEERAARCEGGHAPALRLAPANGYGVHDR